MDSKKHLLIVDDDPEIRSLLKDYLHRADFEVSVASDGDQMKQVLKQRKPDLIVLDLMLPGEDGLTLCRNLRAESDIPIIMLTARGEETDRIVGLEMGADDYLPKPFNPRELLARIKSILRRSEGRSDTNQENVRAYQFADWTLDTTARHLISADQVVVSLSGGEYRLLSILLGHPNHVLNRDHLIDLMQGRESLPFDRSIDIQISRLRKRLMDDAREPTLIKTVRGEGYILATAVKKVF